MLEKIIPFEKIIYQSSLNQEELLEHLKNNVGTGNPNGFGVKKQLNGNLYYGKITDNTFEIMRSINYRNSFLPKITGEITNGFTGAKVKVEMKLLLFVKIFIIVWLSGVCFACIGVLYSYLSESKFDLSAFTFIPFIMLIFGLLMVIFGFKYESKKSIKELEELLKAKIIPQNSRL